jgi:hypothetical protein
MPSAARPWSVGSNVLRVGVPVLAAVAIAVAGTGVGHAAGTNTVSATPAGWTPYVVSADSTVRQLTPAGSLMYAVGTFTKISNSAGHAFVRNNAFSFDAATGAVSAWAPNVNGTVYSATVSADGTSVYLGGSFTAVNGVSVGHLAKVSATTGAVDTAFKGRASGTVQAVLLQGTHLLVGGSFTSLSGLGRLGFGSLNPATGAIDSYVNVNVAGSINGNPTSVLRLHRNHAGTKLLGLGNFTSVSGQPRQQIFMVDLGTTSATLDSWNSSLFSLKCDKRFGWWVRAATWTPDDLKVVVATTGYKGSLLCDVAAELPAIGTNVTPIWVNRTGCDSLYSVAATPTTVYFGGHERWIDNNGCDYKGTTGLDRPGIGAVDGTTGLATTWNPTRDRGHGADDMQLTAQGLWVASDNYFGSVYCAHRYHPGICLFPWSS